MTSRGTTFWKSGSVPVIEPEFLGSIISAAADIAMVVSQDGIVLSVLVNEGDDSFGNLSHWEDRPIYDFLTSESIDKFQDLHARYLKGDAAKRPVELNHQDNAIWQYPVRYTLHRFGQDKEVLLLGRDLRAIAETQQQLVQAQIAIEQGYETRREFDARYRVMMAQTTDAVVFIQVTSGRVDEANSQAGQLLGLKSDALSGSAFASLFANVSNAEFIETLVTATLSEEIEPVAATAARTGNALTLHPTLFRAGGQRVLMCRIKAASNELGEAELGGQPSGMADMFFRAAADAMLFVDQGGDVLSVNDAFLDLVGAARKSDVAGRSLADFLVRGQIDLGLMLGSTNSPGRVRVYATRMLDQLGTKLAVEISLTRLAELDKPVFGLVIRDASRLEPVRSAPGTSDSLPNSGEKIVELVGSATLKEIVAETTDVVEKLCIETAVALTRNNRVAAAEMLGLSRQSLYVKLRKYGLLSRD